MNEVNDERKIKRRTIIIFSIINLILVTGIVMFIVAVIYGGSGVLDFEVGLGVYALFIMIIAGVVD